MGDLLKSYPIFEKLGFNESNQWFLYTEGMQDFFLWIANNITEENIMTEEDLYLQEKLKASGEWYEGEELERRLAELEEKHPGITTRTEKDVRRKKEEMKVLDEMVDDYKELNAKIDQTASDLNKEISDLEMELHLEEKQFEEVSKEAVELAKKLEEIQKENAINFAELQKCYLEPQTPPLFMHQMPLEEFFSKVDQIQQHLDMYINANIKIKTSPDDDDTEDNDQLIDELSDLERQLYTTELSLIELKAQNASLEKTMEEFDISQFQGLTISQMKNEMAALDESNKHLENTVEVRMSELKSVLKEQAHLQIENVLFENTKIKLERASKRLESVKELENILTDVMDTSEILWVLMQLDMEMVKNFCEDPPTATNDNTACARRIETMLQQMSNPSTSQEDALTNRFADMLTTHLKIQRPKTLKACFEEYEKFHRMSNNTLKAIVEKKHYKSSEQTLEKLKSLEKIYTDFIFDGPTNKPTIDHKEFVEPIYEAIRSKEEVEKELRRIRYDIQTNYTDRMKNDRFWRYEQLLWIWFLHDPKKMFQAIEEVKKAASNGPSMKMLGGIQRKESEK